MNRFEACSRILVELKLALNVCRDVLVTRRNFPRFLRFSVALSFRLRLPWHDTWHIGRSCRVLWRGFNCLMVSKSFWQRAGYPRLSFVVYCIVYKGIFRGRDEGQQFPWQPQLPLSLPEASSCRVCLPRLHSSSSSETHLLSYPEVDREYEDIQSSDSEESAVYSNIPSYGVQLKR